MTILLRGLKGEPVKRLQGKLGIEADGVFGPGTEKALKDYQQKHGLKIDGIAGPDTFASMGLQELILLRRGSRGETVKKLQESLKITADGRYGPDTEKAVKDYQQKNSLKADGVAGPETLGHMKLFGVSKASIARSVVEGGKKIWDTVEEASKGALAKVKDFLGL